MDQQWQPAEHKPFKVNFFRAVSLLTYPTLAPFALFSRCDTTVSNARSMRTIFMTLGVGLSVVCHAMTERRSQLSNPVVKALSHLGVCLTVDYSFFWLTYVAHQLIEIIGVDRKENRLNAGKLNGPRVIIIGNGPSALEGKEYGDKIDSFDEVVRFNNFQSKADGLHKWVGSKCTVHFSDGVLYPTYTKYFVPGATVVLSLFADRFIVAGTYFVFRGVADMETRLTAKFLKDPDVSWIDKERIESVKEKLGLSGLKHPTSGMLAIDYFVNKPGVQLPLVIHGFDFFMGPTIHYYHKEEPLYERINNQIGVNQHSPHKEKVYVEKLIAEGKVIFIKDLP